MTDSGYTRTAMKIVKYNPALDYALTGKETRTTEHGTYELTSKSTDFYPTKKIYDIAKKDGRWHELFRHKTIDDATKDAFLDRRLAIMIDYIKDGKRLDPVEIEVIPYPEGAYWMITDGFHRTVAAKLLKVPRLEAQVKVFSARRG